MLTYGFNTHLVGDCFGDLKYEHLHPKKILDILTSPRQLSHEV
jgi:hypothetical protein